MAFRHSSMLIQIKSKFVKVNNHGTHLFISLRIMASRENRKCDVRVRVAWLHAYTAIYEYRYMFRITFISLDRWLWRQQMLTMTYHPHLVWNRKHLQVRQSQPEHVYKNGNPFDSTSLLVYFSGQWRTSNVFGVLSFPISLSIIWKCRLRTPANAS